MFCESEAVVVSRPFLQTLVVEYRRYLTTFFVVGKGVKKFVSIYNRIENLMSDIIREFIDGVPSSITRADFDVLYLLINVARKKEQINIEQVVDLGSLVNDCEKVWKKLNDV